MHFRKKIRHLENIPSASSLDQPSQRLRWLTETATLTGTTTAAPSAVTWIPGTHPTTGECEEGATWAEEEVEWETITVEVAAAVSIPTTHRTSWRLTCYNC